MFFALQLERWRIEEDYASEKQECAILQWANTIHLISYVKATVKHDNLRLSPDIPLD